MQVIGVTTRGYRVFSLKTGKSLGTDGHRLCLTAETLEDYLRTEGWIQYKDPRSKFQEPNNI